MKKKRIALLLLLACFILSPVVSSCTSYRSYWGVEGEYGSPLHYRGKKHKKHHKPKHRRHRHHHHHDDDD